MRRLCFLVSNIRVIDNIPASPGCIRSQGDGSGRTLSTELDTWVRDKAVEEFFSPKYVSDEMLGRFLTHCGLGKEERIPGRWYERREKGTTPVRRRTQNSSKWKEADREAERSLRQGSPRPSHGHHEKVIPSYQSSPTSVFGFLAFNPMLSPTSHISLSPSPSLQECLHSFPLSSSLVLAFSHH